MNRSQFFGPYMHRWLLYTGFTVTRTHYAYMYMHAWSRYFNLSAAYAAASLVPGIHSAICEHLGMRLLQLLITLFTEYCHM